MSSTIIATENERSLWEEYLLSKREFCRHHAWSWNWRSIIEQSFGHRPYYLLARHPQNNSPVGILPLIQVKSRVFGHALYSLPYLNAGGLIADSVEVGASLQHEAHRLAQELGASHIEYRAVGANSVYNSDFAVRSHKVAMHLPLNANPEQVFAGFPAKLRSQIRRPTKAGLVAESVQGDKADERLKAAFYRVFCENMRDLGTPVYPKKLFSLTLRGFAARSRILIIWQGAQPVAAGLTIGSAGQVVEIPWASSLRRAKELSPNMLLYWECIKAACLDGYQVFDFGRSSPDSGTFRFKQQWGANPVNLHWYYDILQGEPPDVNPNNPKFRALVKCWQHLPLAAANFLGPWLTRSLP